MGHRVRVFAEISLGISHTPAIVTVAVVVMISLTVEFASTTPNLHLFMCSIGMQSGLEMIGDSWRLMATRHYRVINILFFPVSKLSYRNYEPNQND